MEDRVWIALIVRFAPSTNPKADMFVEAPGLWILLVHVDCADTAAVDGVENQPLLDAFAPALRRDEKHLKFVSGDSHEGDGFAFGVFRNRQNRNFAEGGGNILCNPPDFRLGEKLVSSPDRLLSDVQQLAEQGSVSIFYFDDLHDVVFREDVLHPVSYSLIQRI